MKLHDTLIDLLDEARSRDRELRLIDGENDESVVRFPGNPGPRAGAARVDAGARHAAW